MTYRIIAVTLILLGILVIAKATTKRTHAQSETITMPIRCDGDGCRAIMPDGTLSFAQVAKPENYIERVGGCK